MPLELQAEGEASLPVESAALQRGLGLRPWWACRVPWGTTGRTAAILARWSTGRVITLLADGQALGEFAFSGARAASGSGGAPAWAVQLAAPVPALPPRRRVLSGTSYAALFNGLNVSVERNLAGVLQHHALPPDTCVIADGASDLEAAVSLLAAYRRAAGAIASCHLGWQSEGNPPQWRLHCASAMAGPPPTWDDAVVGGVHGDAPHWALMPCAMLEAFAEVDRETDPVLGITLQAQWRGFDSGLFAQWTSLPLPGRMDHNGGFDAWRATEELKESRGELHWRSNLHAYPRGLRAPGWPAFPPWFGYGTCVESSTGEHGVSVRATLDGFGEGVDTLTACLNAVYTADGKHGLHLPPEPKSRIALAWSGRVGDLPLCLGNVRSEKPSNGKAFLDLPERDWEWDVAGQFKLNVAKTMHWQAQKVKVSVASTMDVEGG